MYTYKALSLECCFLLWELTVAKPYRLWCPSHLAKYFVTKRNRCCLPRLFYLWFSQSLVVLDFFSNKWQNHSTDIFHLCAVASLGFAGVFAFQELLCLSFDFFLVPHFLQIYSGFFFSLFYVHISLLWDFPIISSSESSFSHKIQHGNLTVTSDTQTRWSVKLCVGQRCHGSTYLSFSDYEKYIRSRSDLDKVGQDELHLTILLCCQWSKKQTGSFQ